MLSEVDPALHLAVERNRAFNYATFKPRYYFINGRSMPDTLAPNNASWLPNQPYGALVHVALQKVWRRTASASSSSRSRRTSSRSTSGRTGPVRSSA